MLLFLWRRSGSSLTNDQARIPRGYFLSADKIKINFRRPPFLKHSVFLWKKGCLLLIYFLCTLGQLWIFKWARFCIADALRWQLLRASHWIMTAAPNYWSTAYYFVIAHLTACVTVSLIIIFFFIFYWICVVCRPCTFFQKIILTCIVFDVSLYELLFSQLDGNLYSDQLRSLVAAFDRDHGRLINYCLQFLQPAYYQRAVEWARAVPKWAAARPLRVFYRLARWIQSKFK